MQTHSFVLGVTSYIDGESISRLAAYIIVPQFLGFLSERCKHLDRKGRVIELLLFPNGANVAPFSSVQFEWSSSYYSTLPLKEK